MKKTNKLWNLLQHCPYNRNYIINSAWPKSAATDNQLLAYMNRVLYETVTVLCRVLTSAHFPLTIVFVDASQFKLIWNVFQLLFICLFTHSHKSAVLFLLLLCVVLVLYSYQESTLLWRPWIPLIKNKTWCNEYKFKGLYFWFYVHIHVVLIIDSMTWCLTNVTLTKSPLPK